MTNLHCPRSMEESMGTSTVHFLISDTCLLPSATHQSLFWCDAPYIMTLSSIFFKKNMCSVHAQFRLGGHSLTADFRREFTRGVGEPN